MLVQFQQPDGHIVAINPSRVALIQNIDATNTTTTVLIDGEQIVVRGSFMDVYNALNGQVLSASGAFDNSDRQPR